MLIGTAGGDTIAISAAELELKLSLVDAERAWRSLPEWLES